MFLLYVEHLLFGDGSQQFYFSLVCLHGGVFINRLLSIGLNFLTVSSILALKPDIVLNFNEFGFNSTLLDGLDSMGFQEATPIQEQTIPVILQQHDLIACAQTGTGKTAAYLLPILHKLSQNPREVVNAIIIVPTRELAM